MQRRLINLLRDLSVTEGLQIVMATHSKEIVNNVAPDLIISVSNEEERAVRLGTYEDVLAVLKEIGSLDNVDAATLLRSKRAVFVEGDEDSLLSVFARTLGIPAFEGSRLTVVIPLKGAENVSRISEIRTFERLLDARLSAIVIRDRDYIPDEAAARFIKEAESYGVKAHIWKRTMVENYLLVPGALHRAVVSAIENRNAATGQTQDAPAYEEIDKLLAEALEETREEARARIAGSIQRADRRVAPETAVRQANEILTAYWTNTEGKIANSPGKMVLSAFQRRIRERYSISFSNLKLAEAIRADEIDQEIVDVLSAVANL